MSNCEECERSKWKAEKAELLEIIARLREWFSPGCMAASELAQAYDLMNSTRELLKKNGVYR